MSLYFQSIWELAKKAHNFKYQPDQKSSIEQKKFLFGQNTAAQQNTCEP